MIMNRCLYDALNFVLDEFRPFGNRGMPGICIKTVSNVPPKEDWLVKKMKARVNQLTSIRMGIMSMDESDK